jgi:molybdopterin converting factor subunit 1
VTVTVRLFAMLRERAGESELQLSMPESATVAMAEAELAKRYPGIADLIAKAAVAVNRQYATRQTVLYDADELAVIPPVSGG